MLWRSRNPVVAVAPRSTHPRAAPAAPDSRSCCRRALTCPNPLAPELVCRWFLSYWHAPPDHDTRFVFHPFSQCQASWPLCFGRGKFRHLAPSVQAFQLQQDFAGIYSPGNWTFTSDQVLGDGSVDLASTPADVTLTGSNSSDLTAYFGSVNSDFTTIAAATGPVSFDWSFYPISYILPMALAIF